MSRDRETMSEELYRKIIDDCATFQVQAIEPFLNGEPFMDPQIVPRLKYLRERLPATKLRLYSNGNAMVPKRVDELLGIGIDHLYISLNTLDPAKYQTVMGLRLERTLHNIEYFLDPSRRNRLAREITVRMTRTQDTTADDQARFAAYCKQRKVNCMMVGLFNYLGDVNSSLPVPSFPCEHITRVDVLSSGQVTLCAWTPREVWLGGRAQGIDSGHLQRPARAQISRDAPHGPAQADPPLWHVQSVLAELRRAVVAASCAIRIGLRVLSSALSALHTSTGPAGFPGCHEDRPPEHLLPHRLRAVAVHGGQ